MKILRANITALLAAVLMCGCADGGQAEETTAETIPTTVTEETTTVSTTVSTTVTTTEEVTESTTVTTEFPFEDTADNAYQRLYMAFITEDGIEFPEDYAGAYGYAGTLFVVITEKEPSEYYTEILGEYTCVEYKTADNSFERLTEISEEARELLAAEFGVAETFVDVPSNKAGISIINGDPKKAQNFLKTIEDKTFTLDQLEISMAEPAETSASE